MKYTANENWFTDLFKSKKKKEEESSHASDENESNSLFLDSSEIDEILNALKTMTNDQWNSFLEDTDVKIIGKQQYAAFVVNGIMKLERDIETNLMPKWSKMEAFHWHDDEHNPVDSETGEIKVPALASAMKAAGSVAAQLLRSIQFTNSYNYSKVVKRDGGTLKELGYNKNDIVNFIKFLCLFDDYESKATDTYRYCMSDSHKDGYCYVVNHIFVDYYNDPDKWPDLQNGEKVFLTAESAFAQLEIDGRRLLRKFVSFNDLGLDI